MTHPFIIGEKYQDRVGVYTVVALNETGGTVDCEYEDGTKTTARIEVKARIYKNILAELRVFHPIQTATYFQFLGFLVQNSEFNAEAPLSGGHMAESSLSLARSTNVPPAG